MVGLCDNCQNREAVTSCEVCGSRVCRECKLENGFKSFKVGVQTF